jgi:hypothetical protein
VIETQVKDAKETDRLRILKRPLAQLARAVTELSKQASDELINQSFDKLFLEECEALRAPNLKIQFVGREGAARRRKVLGGARHKPSKVLSEGEQKVLAMADFLGSPTSHPTTSPAVGPATSTCSPKRSVPSPRGGFSASTIPTSPQSN